ncbi:hypothetical protein B0H13DRAFT_1730038 [Mycena leptocephala]|nr:hypothetical protein B0H13DRAFT_1730038 [Mycena leptocephala]
MPRFPQPEGNSGQRYGENFDTFFARRKARNHELAEKESGQGKKKCLQQEAHAATGAPPGKQGARVFVWEEEENGFLIRRAINRNSAADMWDEFTPTQRLYDGYHNEWDLCTALAPDEEPENDGDDGPDDDDNDYGDVEGGGVPDNGLPELIDIGDRLILERSPPTTADLLHSHGLEPGEIYDDALPVEQASRDTFEIPFARFGFKMPIAPSTYREGPPRIVCLKSLGNDKLKDPLPERYPVHILLSSAATAVMVIRMGWGPDEIIHRLLEHGVEFRICLMAGAYHVPLPPPRASYTGLGYRRPKYKPTPVDHGVYMMLRNRFLASPRGRTALFVGGIVAHLARLVVDQELASLGPTSEVFRTGIRLWDGQSSAAYWDDALTEQEIDLICGVYEIGTGAPETYLSTFFLTVCRSRKQNN